ncbi:MAG: LamG-like jellyroll fold domain-containing protein [Candidatus Paceibacterota bacterium]|jgi:prepilin-type N-terminal cleavage/methylation domain-containing protein
MYCRGIFCRYNYGGGFTLIELLVVVAIVGILAGMVVVNMTGATDSARMAKSKSFSGSIRSSLLMERSSEWNLDEGSGATATDGVGISNCVLIGSPVWKTGADCVSGSCLQFNGSNTYANCGADPSLTPASITLETWAKPATMPTWMGIISNMSTWGTGFSLQMGTAQNIAIMVSGSYLQTTWRPEVNKWYHIVATHDSQTNLNVLYVNGKEERRSTQAISYESDPKTYIGVFYTPSTLVFSGTIDEVKIYNKALTSSQIKNSYMAGLDRLLVNKQITPGEYGQKLIGSNPDHETKYQPTN